MLLVARVRRRWRTKLRLNCQSTLKLVVDTCRRRRHGCIRRIHVSERDMWRIHVAIGDMDVSKGYMYPSTTCGGYMSPSATWMYPKDTCIPARHVADTCRHRRHGCIQRIHVSERDMYPIHVSSGRRPLSLYFLQSG